MTNERLSTRWTIFYWVFSLPFAGAMVLGLRENVSAPIDFEKVCWFVPMMALLGWNLWLLLSLTHVTATEDELVIRGLFRSARVRYVDIADVRKRWWFSSKVVRVSTRAGQRYDFAPCVVWTTWLQPHPVVERLREKMRERAA